MYMHPKDLQWETSKVEGISSKDLLGHHNGSFKMIRLKPNSVYPVHHHPKKTEFVYVLYGTLEATIGEEQLIGNEGAFFQFPVGVKHGLKNIDEEETVLLVGAIQENDLVGSRPL